ncbi:MAG: radical SAM protein [Prevotellaceae bacterium]|jgi:uncharacterized protein|nr:radical SAM protein [Prevotellaceae bacterium]
MKYSQFNSIIPYRDKFAVYNSFENKVIFLEPELKDILLSEVKNMDNLKKLHPEFYDYLLYNKFIVSDDYNEIEAVKKISGETDNNAKMFHLTINPTMNCNFKCWYCYETHVKQSYMSCEIMENIKKLTSSLLQDKDLEFLYFSFFGGEPLIYFIKNVIPLIDFAVQEANIYDKKLSIGFTTNGYLINDRLINYFNKKQVKPHFQITLDGYHEKHDKVRFITETKGSYFTIINNIKKLIKNEMPVRLRINYTNENLDDTYKIADDFADTDREILKKYLMIDYHRVWQNQKADDLNVILDRNLQIFRDKGLNVLGSFNQNSIRSSCYADKRNSAVINYNGDVFKCTARDFTTEIREGFLNDEGKIIWENNSLERRMNAKFHNKPCLSCRLLAICNGGCSQHALDNLGKEGFCINYFDETEKDKVIKTKVDLIVYEHEKA